MLSRIAESMFWIGRYVERAESTARILDVHYHLVVQDALVDESAACAALLSVMGARDAVGNDVTLESINEVLGYSLKHPSSIASTLFAARENARGAREAISSEMWETLNATHHALPGRVTTARSLGPNSFFRYVKERAAIVGGLVDSTLCRDDGYRFLVLGRALERVDMTARLLIARATVADTPGGWVTTLLCCSAHEAYLRTYRRAVDAYAATSGQPMAERVPAAFIAYLEPMFSDHPAARIAFVEVMGVSPRLEEIRLGFRESLITFIETESAAAVTRGEVADRDFRFAALALIGAANALVYDWVISPRPPSEPEMRAALSRLATTLLVA